MRTALIIVDVQNDFLPAQGSRGDGALAVPRGNEVVPVIQRLLEKKSWDWDLVIATQDYHPPRHISFASRHPPHEVYEEIEVTDAHGKTYKQQLWPDHCIQGTPGVEIEPELQKSLGVWSDKLRIARKACYPDVEAYSAFEGYITDASAPHDPPDDPGARQLADTDFTKLLRTQGIDKVVVTGLATDFCVRSTASDSIAAGFDTVILAPTVRAVSDDRVEAVFDELEKQGGRVLGRDAQEWEQALRTWTR